MTKTSTRPMLLLFALILITLFAFLEAGKKVRVEGVILTSNGNRIMVDNLRGRQFLVQVQPQTQIEEKKQNFLRDPRIYRESDLVRGLRVIVRGRLDDSGAVLAKTIKMKNIDLKVASTVESRAAGLDNRLDGMGSDVVQISSQVEELTGTSERVRKDARETRSRLDHLAGDVRKTTMQVGENAREMGSLKYQLSELDHYRLLEAVTIQFQTASFGLDEGAHTQLDELMATAAKQNQGILFQITGFASADGPDDFNRYLSRKRAESVIQYLAEKHAVPLRWFVRPHGYGELMAVADNSTSEGRQANRRAEVKVLLNETIAELAMN